MLIFGVIWWVAALIALDLLLVGWLIRPHYNHRSGDYEWWPLRTLGWWAVTVTALLWLGGFNLPFWIWENPMQTFVTVVIYLIIGGVWCYIHWMLWRGSEEQREVVKRTHETWLRSKDPETPITRAEFKKWSGYPYGWSKDHSMIETWAIFWPIDMVLYFLGDFLVNVVTAVGRAFSGLFAAYGDRVDKSVIGGD